MERDRHVEYREAFPELCMKEVARSYRHGPRHVEWFDEMHEIIGTGEVRWQETKVELRYEFDARWGAPPENGRRIFFMDVVYRGSHSWRFYALCRLCGRYKPRLFFRIREWACHECHCLPNRSKFLTSVERWSEELAGLRFGLRSGRPFGMREKEYAGGLRRMDELTSLLAGRRKLPDPYFLRGTYAVWKDGVLEP